MSETTKSSVTRKSALWMEPKILLERYTVIDPNDKHYKEVGRKFSMRDSDTPGQTDLLIYFPVLKHSGDVQCYMFPKQLEKVR